MGRIGIAAGLVSLALVAGCQRVAGGQSSGASQQAFDAIAEDETIRLVGTEPFWGGTVEAGRLVYMTPENQIGETIAVKRFAGNSGLGLSGTRGGKPLDVTITRGACSDGMSDRTYPYTATLRLDAEQRNGCAWTDRQPFSGPANP
ncbi:MAG TPA: hypothetical protein VFS87_04750 [Qipengyuania sp.]|nr:hypothetical protein [Qipengyuania sp.]